MCYKHGQNIEKKDQPKRSLFPSSYFERQAIRQQCVQCKDKVNPEEVKSALGVCTVFMMQKTYEWMTTKN